MSNTKTAAPRRAGQGWLNPRTLRDLHLYLAVFFGPTIIFFAVTGAYQLFGLHEASRDGAYAPAPFVEKMAQVHIHQRYAIRAARPPAAQPAAPNQGGRPDQASRPATPPAAGQQASSTLAAKVFFLGTGIGLTLVGATGMWIGITQSRRRRAAAILAILGVVIPFGLLALQ